MPGYAWCAVLGKDVMGFCKSGLISGTDDKLDLGAMEPTPATALRQSVKGTIRR
jgi:hypothetical protein